MVPQFNRVRRLGVAMALVPLAPGVSLAAIHFLDGSGVLARLTWLDDEQVFNALFCLLTVGGALLIFRSVVLWTFGRATLTAVVTLVPLTQVVLNRPMLNTRGCGSETILNLAQEQIGLGLWVWLAIWVWWGWERGAAAAAARARTHGEGGVTMTGNARRVAATLGLFPFSFGVFWITAVVLDEHLSLPDAAQLPLAYAVAALAMIAVWMFIWRRAVVWDRRTINMTVWLTAGLLVMPIALSALGGVLSSPWDNVVQILPLIGWGAWIAVLLARWPMRPAAARTPDGGPVCIRCGYNLRGLRATRCPECGDEPTLDELWTGTDDGW